MRGANPHATDALIALWDDGGWESGGKNTMLLYVRIYIVEPWSLTVSPANVPLQSYSSWSLAGGSDGSYVLFYVWLRSDGSEDTSRFSGLRSQNRLVLVDGPRRRRWTSTDVAPDVVTWNDLPSGTHTVFVLIFPGAVDWAHSDVSAVK
eukprot:gene43449-13178_t